MCVSLDDTQQLGYLIANTDELGNLCFGVFVDVEADSEIDGDVVSASLSVRWMLHCQA
jgi:hypothetical protein